MQHQTQHTVWLPHTSAHKRNSRFLAFVCREVSLKLDELRSNGLQYKIVLKPDDDKGYGAYAGEGLPGHNTLLGEYAGELLTEQVW